jgi:hypothetical protein
MSVFNRRNALVGWLAWQALKFAARQKAVRRAAGDRSRPVVRSVASAAAVAAAVGGALVFWRRRSRSDAVPPVSGDAA